MIKSLRVESVISIPAQEGMDRTVAISNAGDNGDDSTRQFQTIIVEEWIRQSMIHHSVSGGYPPIRRARLIPHILASSTTAHAFPKQTSSTAPAPSPASRSPRPRPQPTAPSPHGSLLCKTQKLTFPIQSHSQLPRLQFPIPIPIQFMKSIPEHFFLIPEESVSVEVEGRKRA